MSSIAYLDNMEKWDKRFLRLAREISTWSKDPSTQVGVVIVKDRKILSIGYNGFPEGIRDHPARLNNREEKYKYVVHGEMNSIYNAIKNGVSLEGSTLYVIGTPTLPVCGDCAKAIASVGIVRVVTPKYTEVDPKWKESCLLAESILFECGIEYDYIDLDIQ